jgi:nucleotide-binding universal stress UspA family protein
MRAPKTILVATDFSRLADVGADVALILGRRMGAKVHAVHVLEPVVPMYPLTMSAGSVDAIDSKRRALAMERLESIRGKDIVVTREIRDGIPSRELVAAADEAKADLIVIASHGYGPVRRTVLGSVAATLIRMSSVPVLIVGEERHDLDFAVVLAGVDLSPISSDVLELARTFVAPRGSVNALSFVDQPLVMVDDLLPYYPTHADQERLIAERIKAVRALMPDGGPQVQIDALAKGPPAIGILESAELLDADLVVVGTSGHNAWHRAFIGSTATRVLAEAKCPVLVVPAKPAGSPGS